MKREKIGEFPVDTGMCWVGDPMNALNVFDSNSEELGVLFSTGYGDGIYEVHADIIKDSGGYERVKTIHIEFIGDAK